MNNIVKSEVFHQKLWQPLPQGIITRIAFGSCAKQWQYQPIWQAVIDINPDLFLFLGDAIYADTDGKTAWNVSEKQLQGEWNRLDDKPEFQAVKAKIPFMAVWDNHDYGTHNGGAEFPLKEQSKAAFLDFFGEPIDSPRRKRKGIYDAHIFGTKGQRVQIILLDTRYFKGPFIKDPRTSEEKAKLGIVGKYLPNEDPNVTLLGEAQWQWLKEQLEKPAEVRLIASSTQIIADQKGMDEWGNYPHERRKLFKLIEDTNAKGVIFLSGNVHFAEISVWNDSNYPLYDFTSSGMTHVEPKYASVENPYRVNNPYVNLNFGLVEIDWNNLSETTITLRLLSLNGESKFEHKILF
ncbi:MAG: alkaline phosphatase family protein [Crocosphaera sp.]|uniref:Phosphodiesterase/alkaline phosphatase D-like protein n=3 Tax=Crocosphaera watsonii TaxID=263511 RepID=T2JWW7_CROWT|nr:MULTISPECIES: alkaline phosphatase D family protein [Crocosphaera]EHJ14387.1 putative phosphodiesterase/alkaline phosphatase D [Crocosphaera watsonii WH 0003]MCH2245926.1 alkaline phosphatase family protein [Crocosphaera sp.]NQZ64660.1 alkaline phosphatase family protein [Crocosphaera sp.]CCQ56927.1 Phosphodiesterase/alkaline phosphatase D-like protein [Crocosphaera watsonii WH 0005]CCQ69564.1 Phosphodiesterase/alkaline phosphatase D-like protein [Crocosphaera watsonii WH 0402]